MSGSGGVPIELTYLSGPDIDRLALTDDARIPFSTGGLFQRVRGETLPAWAAEMGCGSWAQLFLKWILAHPAVTCVIPGTSQRQHVADNLKAGVGTLPDSRTRERMAALVAG